MRCGCIGRSSWLARGLSSTMPGLPLQNSPDLCSLHVEFGDHHVCQLCRASHQIQETPGNIHGHGSTRVGVYLCAAYETLIDTRAVHCKRG
ncbi:hypothetical protein PVAP13_8KG157500 [Panicum virgatum]|uniref:Uncharacterized protein n=1 Tax=Panicum virgatum TaxID=38727 RepID=A0A8T0PIK0_PANVG|nr:hypothetical protein PVAP13_8KG157500 [Panicum virgatum]